MRCILFVLILFCVVDANAYEFENIACFSKDAKGDINVIDSLHIGEVSNLEKAKIDKPTNWTQNSESTEFVQVVTVFTDGDSIKEIYRVINGDLHLKFKKSDGETIFRKIIPRLMPQHGYREQVLIRGTRLTGTFISQLECQKEIF